MTNILQMKKLFFLLLFSVGLSSSLFAQVRFITVHELEPLLDESLLLIDARTDLEYDQGYIPGAVNINLYSKSFEQQVNEYDRNRPVYLYCRTGHRSVTAADKLISMGFREVYSLEGGMMRWQRARKPVIY
jgi:phage shock protein E